MPTSFIHTADWQIGAPFGRFTDERKRTLLREARLTVIDRIAETAVAKEAAHVLVAGDVFDSPTVADQLLRQTMARLAKYGRLTWHLLPGNHDPLRAGGVWDRLAAIGLPANVIAHTTPKPHALDAHTVLLPAPLSGSASSHDPTAWMDTAETQPGMVRIGLAHGSVRGFGSEAQAAQQISPARATTANLAYLALGDWHGATRISDRVWYAGTPEPDRYRDNQPGFVISVKVGARQTPVETPVVAPVTLESIHTAHFAWAERTLTIDQSADWDRLAAELADIGLSPGTPTDRQLVKLVLRGAVTLAERATIEAGLAHLDPLFFHLEADLDGLHDRAAEDDLAALSDDGVRAIAARLQQMAVDGDAGPSEIARRALRKLMRLDAQLGRAPYVSPRSGDGA
jgi:DNA repair exonuclease SbcCD nuclease subunit